ncbi:MocR-like pyridoxine biosynthesis transcription factor PdxR [Arabiibacter massiliensis]|uniref:MocR-like pyridoxine biosynthesis transcription factor PdxR n=1 Tax=Arabiibacter massiliensis TaxID=1870985 RepID=UPI00155B1827|nr:PLP-dependent aminotransferase family protein [Arabiibacter massiliensis]
MLTYSFDDREGESLYGHLYRCIRRDIESGAIPAHAKLPSKRAFAKHLGVSLITVEGAYQQLMAEGYVRSEPRRGYFANPIAPPPDPAPEKWHKRGLSPFMPFGASEPELLADLSGGSAAAELFPYAVWARTMREVLSREPERALLGASPAMGALRLREALAGHLRAFRGLEVDPACILVGSGAQTLYNLLVQLLGRGLRYAVEDPGYPRLTSVYRANDVELDHVPLDAGGIDVAALAESGAQVAHLMPSHQYPTGIVTSVSRRYELLGWANDAPDRYVVEDDYDCEFRLAGRPIPAMKSIDAGGRVVYLNTFARSLGPAFRIGYAVLPAPLAERFQRELGFYSCTVSTPEQLALARFIENGDFERHVNRMRSHYRGVRDELLAALAACPAAGRLSVEGAEAGLHFLLRVDSSASEADLAAAAQREGVALAPLSAFRQRPVEAAAEQDAPAFVVSYAALDRAAVPHVVEALARAVAAAG